MGKKGHSETIQKWSVPDPVWSIEHDQAAGGNGEKGAI